MQQLFPFQDGETVQLPAEGSWPDSVHVLDADSGWAVNAALAAERPLLVRGEPGCGKSQLARVAAKKLGRAFIAEVVNARGESRDLQWRFDAVARLGEAQTLGRLDKIEAVREQLNPRKYLAPGALWWAFDWRGAEAQAHICAVGAVRPLTPKDWQPERGCVVLIDEIDKAETELPNGLLETLGNGAFTVPYLDAPVGRVKDVPPPLVVITTNEERELPAAFLRRCLALHLDLPDEKDELLAWLEVRGKAHFNRKVAKAVREEAAALLWDDRQTARDAGHPEPGLAEYLDLLRALARLGKGAREQNKALEQIRQFALVKHREQGMR